MICIASCNRQDESAGGGDPGKDGLKYVGKMPTYPTP